MNSVYTTKSRLQAQKAEFGCVMCDSDTMCVGRWEDWHVFDLMGRGLWLTGLTFEHLWWYTVLLEGINSTWQGQMPDKVLPLHYSPNLTACERYSPSLIQDCSTLAKQWWYVDVVTRAICVRPKHALLTHCTKNKSQSLHKCWFHLLANRPQLERKQQCNYSRPPHPHPHPRLLTFQFQ